MATTIQSGDVFTRWTVLRRVADRPNGSGKIACWQCRCECGTEKDIIASALTNGISRSCGCLRAELTRARCLNDLTGQVFERLTVIGPGKKSRYWTCRCECGNEKDISATCLTAGMTRSCGCLRREVTTKRKTIHGQCTRTTRKAEWRAWWAIFSRCHYASNHNYARYGGRGIKMCERFTKSFEAFFEDVGEKPEGDYSIDRKDPNGHYSCGQCEDCKSHGWTANCRWATRETQNRNRRSNHVLEYNGKSQCLAAWAEETGIDRATIAWRLANGWSVGAALTAPARKYKPTE